MASTTAKSHCGREVIVCLGNPSPLNLEGRSGYYFNLLSKGPGVFPWCPFPNRSLSLICWALGHSSYSSDHVFEHVKVSKCCGCTAASRKMNTGEIRRICWICVQADSFTHGESQYVISGVKSPKCQLLSLANTLPLVLCWQP